MEKSVKSRGDCDSSSPWRSENKFLSVSVTGRHSCLLASMVSPLTPLLISCLLLVPVSAEERPNILLIVADDLGWADVPWRDDTVVAPTLRQLARTGVVLNQSYVQQVCTPSRAALLTGLYPFHLGRQHRALKPLRAGGVPTSFTLLPQLLKEQNYSTHIIGKWHLGYCAWEYTPTWRGFDTFYGTYLGVLDHWTHTRDKYDGYDFRRNEEVVFNASGVYSTHLYTQEAVQLITEKQNSSQPFFLYLPYQALHAPLQVNSLNSQKLILFPEFIDKKKIFLFRKNDVPGPPAVPGGGP